MKKILSQILVLVVSIAAAHASNGLKNESHGEKPVRYFQNPYNDASYKWFVSAGVGAQVFFGDHDKQLPFGDRVTPSTEFSVGKWFNETMGVRANFSYARMRGLTQGGGHNGLSTGVLWREYDDLYIQRFNYIHVHADFMFNWLNDVDPRNINKVYHIIPYAGIGFFSAIDKQKGINFAVNLGAINSWVINEKWGLYADLRGTIFRDKTDGEVGGRNMEGFVTLLAGARYAF